MSEVLGVSLINGLFAVLLLILGARLNRRVKRVATDSAATLYQVKNSHTTNLREEADERHEENTLLLREVLEELGSLRRSVRRLWRRTDDQALTLDELTHPGNPTKERDE